MEAREMTLTASELQLKVTYLISIWVEALLYGLYFCLFLGAVSVLARKDARKPFPSKVFLLGNVLMFMAISLHNAINIYRLVVAFAYQTDIRAPLRYLNDLAQWSGLASPILLAIILWIGDALAIYRCFLIWQRNFWVIALPTLLSATTVGMQIVNFWWIAQQGSQVNIIARRWPVLRITFPMYLAQNVVTTALIVLKIWSQSHQAQKTGTGTTARKTSNFVSLMRIIVDSAAIYTASILVMVVLRLLDHPGRLIGHLILYPIIGVVFILMAIRVHAVHEESKQTPPSPSLMPSWMLRDRAEADGVTSTNDDHVETTSSTGTKDDAASRDEVEAIEPQQSEGRSEKTTEICDVKAGSPKPSL